MLLSDAMAVAGLSADASGAFRAAARASCALEWLARPRSVASWPLSDPCSSRWASTVRRGRSLALGRCAHAWTASSLRYNLVCMPLEL